VIRSTTPASVRCSECGADVGDPRCYTADDEPTGYHAARKQAAEELRLQRRGDELEARAKKRGERATLTETRRELVEARAEIRRLRDALAMVANVARAATVPAGPGEERR
jgi:hypothetical protein